MKLGEITNAQEANVITPDPFVRGLQRFAVFLREGGHNETAQQRTQRFSKEEYHLFK
jgi:hypothetical protein